MRGAPSDIEVLPSTKVINYEMLAKEDGVWLKQLTCRGHEGNGLQDTSTTLFVDHQLSKEIIGR